MIVIAIIGIVSTVAVPSYKTYIIKSKISEGMSIMGKVNTIINEYYSSQGVYPTATYIATQFNTTPTGNNINFNLANVSSININPDGSRASYYGICYAFDVKDPGRRCIYVAVKNINDILIFKCGIWRISTPAAHHISDPAYLPSGCNETNLESFFLS